MNKSHSSSSKISTHKSNLKNNNQHSNRLTKSLNAFPLKNFLPKAYKKEQDNHHDRPHSTHKKQQIVRNNVVYKQYETPKLKKRTVKKQKNSHRQEAVNSGNLMLSSYVNPEQLPTDLSIQFASNCHLRSQRTILNLSDVKKHEKRLHIISQFNLTIPNDQSSQNLKAEIESYKRHTQSLEEQLKNAYQMIRDLKQKINSPRSQQTLSSFKQQSITQKPSEAHQSSPQKHLKISSKVTNPFCKKDCKNVCTCISDMFKIVK